MTKILFFHADWDKGSRKMMPIFKAVSENMNKNHYEFLDIDVETEAGVQASIDYQVRNVPTVLIVKRDRVIERHQGSFTFDKLFKMVKKW